MTTTLADLLAQASARKSLLNAAEEQLAQERQDRERRAIAELTNSMRATPGLSDLADYPIEWAKPFGPDPCVTVNIPQCTPISIYTSGTQTNGKLAIRSFVALQPYRDIYAADDGISWRPYSWYYDVEDIPLVVSDAHDLVAELVRLQSEIPYSEIEETAVSLPEVGIEQAKNAWREGMWDQASSAALISIAETLAMMDR